MILVNEAIERLNRAGEPYGVQMSGWSRRSKHRRQVLEIEEVVAPLRLPMELRSLWHVWNPASLGRPCLDGFIPVDEILARRELEIPLSPAVLLPIASWNGGTIWTELASATHPGGRVFRGDDNSTHVDLWAFGVSGLFELLALGFERQIIDSSHGGFDTSELEALATSQVREHVSSISPRRIEAVDRSRFPAHWLSADGLPVDHYVLRGATHTVEEFTQERSKSPQMRATLRGEYENSICGGPIRGCVGTFADTTGEMQVFVPLLAGLAGAIGMDGEVELDVLSFAPNGTPLDSLQARDDMQTATDMGVADVGNDVILRLAEQMRDLDTSIVVTGLRPVR